MRSRLIHGKSVAVEAGVSPGNRTRDFLSVLVVWLLLAVTLIFLAQPNTSVPGLFYDEVHCAGMARDFLTGHPRPHMFGCEIVSVWGRPFPVFVQIYGGALKSWLLLPSFAVFGASQAVLRLTALSWGLVALLLFMLWTWRWLGRNTALLAGALLALDPAFFFSSVLDWGPVLPSFLCRFACFYCTLRWWQVWNEARSAKDSRMGFRGLFHAFLAGSFAGLGFFNKIDFIVLLACLLLALLCCNARSLWQYFVVGQSSILHPPSALLAPLGLACLGCLLAAGPMLPHIPTILNGPLSSNTLQNTPNLLPEKFNSMLAMYDGSYFYRLMDVGGVFHKMYQTRPPIFAPIGIALMLAAAYLVFRPGQDGHAVAFLLLTTLFITIGIFLTPRAVYIHHMVLVYPFPHLVIARAVTRLWQRRRGEQPGLPVRKVLSPPWLVAALFVLLLASQLLVLCQTQKLIRQTGGRGWWSDALSAFARQVKDRSDLTIVSLDWGFNEQLAFLTDGPTLTEPFWNRTATLTALYSTNCIYLAHPPDYTELPYASEYVLEVRRLAGTAKAEVQPWYDHQGQIAFYSLRYSGQ